MVKFVKTIPLSEGSGYQLNQYTRADTTYTEPSQGVAYAYIDPDKYTGATFYFEVTLKTSAGTAYAALYKTDGTVVSGSEVSTTSTSYTRLRSGAITLTAGTYIERIKNGSTNTTTCHDARIIVVQESGAISATETQVKLQTRNGSTTSSSYGVIENIDHQRFLYTSGNYDGTVQIFFEANFKTSAGTGYVALWDETAGAIVSGSEISTTSTSANRVRSSAISLTNGRNYYPVIKNNGTNTTTIYDARVIVQQTGVITKTECYMHLNSAMNRNADESSFTQVAGHRLYYDPAEWSVDTKNFYHEMLGAYQNGSGSISHYDLYKVTDAAQVTNSDLAHSASATMERIRSSALTMPSTAQNLDYRHYQSSPGSQTNYTGLNYLLAVIVWTNVEDFTGGIIII